VPGLPVTPLKTTAWADAVWFQAEELCNPRAQRKLQMVSAGIIPPMKLS